MLDKVAQDINTSIGLWMFEKTSGVVQSGPFVGMKMLKEVSWKENSLTSMLLGCFEKELHQAFEQEIARLSSFPNPKIVNVGCSEGYYAIGLALRLPKATVIAVDICCESLEIASRAAIENGVSSQIIFTNDLGDAFDAPDLVVMDCEGAETVYLDREKFPALDAATIIVEIHNWPNEPYVDDALREHFKLSHSITNIFEGPRNPNEFKFLIDQRSLFRWLAICEYRPCLMNWFVMRPWKAPVETGRKCGECTLCCRLEKVVEINKPSHILCEHCKGGCTIYQSRPQVCRSFACLWLSSPDMPDSLRPDRSHAYAAGNPSDGYLRVCVDSDYPEYDKAIVDYITDKGLHAIVHEHGKHRITFMPGRNQIIPPKILLDWTP